jgi:hypothetical protein
MGRGFVKDTSELKKMKSNYIHVWIKDKLKSICSKFADLTHWYAHLHNLTPSDPSHPGLLLLSRLITWSIIHWFRSTEAKTKTCSLS